MGSVTLRQAVGILFQNPDQQMIAATVGKKLALGLELRGMPHRATPRDRRGTARPFQARRSPTRPLALSGGQKQRVALAAIMAARPRFLLLDKADSFLDAPSRRDFLDAIDSVRGECGLLWMSPDPRRLPAANRFTLEDGTLREGLRS